MLSKGSRAWFSCARLWRQPIGKPLATTKLVKENEIEENS